MKKNHNKIVVKENHEDIFMEDDFEHATMKESCEDIAIEDSEHLTVKENREDTKKEKVSFFFGTETRTLYRNCICNDLQLCWLQQKYKIWYYSHPFLLLLVFHYIMVSYLLLFLLPIFNFNVR